MIKYWLIVFLGLAGITVQAQTGEGFLLEGRIVTDSAQTGLPGAHIVSEAKGSATVSGLDGKFSIETLVGDTLRISYIGYQTTRWAVSNGGEASATIYLQSADEEMEEVVVEGLPSERVLKNRILAMELPDEDKVELNIPAWAARPFKQDPTSAVQLGGIVSGLVSKYNKKDRGRAFKAKLAKDAAEEKIIAAKYNDTVIAYATGIESQDELDAFKAWCELPHSFLLQASEYDIHKAIVECFAEYEAQVEVERKG
jgi:hypothetical protein